LSEGQQTPIHSCEKREEEISEKMSSPRLQNKATAHQEGGKQKNFIQEQEQIDKKDKKRRWQI